MVLKRDDEIRGLLERTKTVAVVGYSPKPDRPSHGVAKAMMRFGYDVYLVNPTAKSTDDERIYASLAEIPVPIDIVDIFRRAEYIMEVVEDAIKVGAKAIWMQQGIINEEAAARAESAGLQVVMDRCIKIDHMVLLRR
jgi:uncharacterized protein